MGFLFLLVIAGNETTTKLIGNALYWLWRFPDQRARLLADPAAIAGAVEEVLRFDTSTQGLARLLTRDVELHGVTLPAGMKGLLLFGSANRDPRRWDRADELDIGRNPAGHVAFGHGIHHCLGAALARLETRVALEELLPRLGDVRDRRGRRAAGCTPATSAASRSLPIRARGGDRAPSCSCTAPGTARGAGSPSSTG